MKNNFNNANAALNFCANMREVIENAALLTAGNISHYGKNAVYANAAC